MHDRIIRSLINDGIAFQLYAHKPMRVVADIEGEPLPFPPERLLKTVLFRLKGGGWVLAAMRARDRIDYKKLAAGLGVSRSDLVAAAPDEVEQLGFQVGGVGPFPPDDQTRVVFDESVMSLEVVCCGSGKNDLTLEMGTGDLLAFSKGQVFSFVQAQ